MLYPKDPAVSVTKSKDSLTVAYKWPPAQGYFLLVIGGMYAFLTGMLFLMPHAGSRSAGRAENAIGILAFFGGIGLVFVYFGAVYLLNRTTVVASSGRIVAVSGPLRARRRKELSTEGVVQFFAAGGSNRSGSAVNRGSIYLMDGEHQVHPLLYSLPSTFAASQVCHELQDFYGLEDQEIYGVTTHPEHPGIRKA